MSSPFVEAIKWQDRWEEREKLAGGGQGEALIVTSRDTGETAFCKVLKSQNDAERRTRFSLEAAAYQSYDHPNLPKLVETNSHLHSNRQFKLYTVLEFIPGGSLGDSLRDPVALSDAVECVSTILETLAYLHANGGVHRDIKPENIILRHSDLRQPVIIDLGLHFSERKEGVHETEHGQELGNRFLRLPELAAGSLAKQDPASDVAFAAGILFFLLTGKRPFTLLDAEGRMPHQREGEADLLRQDRLARKLLRIFDRSFQYRVEDRFRSAAELSAALENLMSGTEEPEPAEPADLLAAIKSDLESVHYQRDAAIQGSCDAIIREAHREMESIATQLSGKYVRTQTGHATFKTGCKTEIGLAHRDDHSIKFLLKVEAHAVGSEIVVSVATEEVARVDHKNFDLPKVRESIRKAFISAAKDFHDDTHASGI